MLLLYLLEILPEHLKFVVVIILLILGLRFSNLECKLLHVLPNGLRLLAVVTLSDEQRIETVLLNCGKKSGWMPNSHNFQVLVHLMKALHYVVHRDVRRSARHYLRLLESHSLEDQFDDRGCLSSARRTMNHGNVLR